MEKVTIYFSKSSEGVPVIATTDSKMGFLGSTTEVTKVITGSEAQSIWDKLTKSEGGTV